MIVKTWDKSGAGTAAKVNTFLSPIEVDRPGLMEIPVSSGNGMDVCGCTTTLTPALEVIGPRYSFCSILNTNFKPVKEREDTKYGYAA